MENQNVNKNWPVLDFNKLQNTIATVQLWTQIVGKIRLRKMPWLNHSWHVTLYISSRGISTGSIPHNNGIFQIDFDFISHELQISSSEGQIETVKLKSGTVADFYEELFSKLSLMNIEVEIYDKPNELEEAIKFPKDRKEREYNEDEMHNYWKSLVAVQNVFTRFRSGFVGKVSPVHFFWGAFDLAVSRFSGREAPKMESVAPNMPQDVMQEAYSHEVCSCGFWPGSKDFPEPSFYSYVYPATEEYANYKISPEEAYYSKEMGEFLLSYKDVQQSEDPENYLLQFLESTYKAASKTGNWDKNLQCDLTHFEKN